MKIEALEQAQAIAKQCMQACGELEANPVCTSETKLLYGLESNRFLCVINKCTGRVLWFSRRRH